MNEMNKSHMKSGVKAFLMFFISLIAIIAFAGNLNAVTVNGLESFYGWGAGINFVAEIFLIFSLRKAWKKNDQEKKDE